VKTSTPFLNVARSVQCTCDPALQVNIGLPGYREQHVATCLRCGQVTVSQLLLQHVHHNTYEPYGREEVSVTEEIRSWLAKWPRQIKTERQESLYFPASLRCSSPREMFDFVQSQKAAQLQLAEGRRLRLAGIPEESPPALPEVLNDFAQLWELNRALQPSTDIEVLFKHADPRYFLSSALAIDALLSRDDLPGALRAAIFGDDHYGRMTACAIATEGLELRPLVLPMLLEWIERAASRFGQVCEPWQYREVLDRIKAWKPDAELAAEPLERAAKAIGARDYEMVRKITEIVRGVRGEPPLPISSVPWFFN
jgi:hypothetical protein